MKNKSRIFSVLIWGPVFIVPAIVLIILFTVVRTGETNHKKSLNTLENNIIEENKKRVSQRVKTASDLISYEKSIIKQELHSRIKLRVNNTLKIAMHLYEKHHKTMEKEKLQTIIIDALRPLVWNRGESFIWILDYNGVFYLAPEYLRHLEGSSIINLKDATGREIIKEEIEISKSIGEGFLWDTFTKPNGGSKKQYKQLAFVKDFGHYNWYFGSSEYLDTAIQKTDTILLKKLSKIISRSSEHLFILNHDGDILLHPLKPELEGQNIFTSKDPHMAKVIPLFRDRLISKEDGFIPYQWVHPVSKKTEKKITYVKLIPESDWIIGSGFFYSDIAKTVAAEKDKLSLLQKESREKMLILGAILVLVSFIISVIISKWIEKQFLSYEKKIKSSNIALKDLNESLENKVKERTRKLEDANIQLEKLATTDALTQVHNRYFFMKSIEAEVKRFQRYKNPFSLIMFDLDYFKQVNDRYGHQKGDEILISVSRSISSSLRETDTIFRFGGEEFMVLLPETKLDKAFDIADRMRSLIEQYDFGIEAQTTISIGVVVFQENDTVDSIISKVDSLLYNSKDEGRNTISKMRA